MNTFLFDLDGTLLPMDQTVFMEAYFRELAKKCMPMGYEVNGLIQSIWAGTKAMVVNDGSATNEIRFWDTFADILGEKVRLDEPEFTKFYSNEFNRVKKATTPTPLANECIGLLKEKGYMVVLATNPIFPRKATLARIDWAGLNPEDFAYITTYENSSYTKPNLNYFRDILKKIGKKPGECMMVGNDVKEDMCAAQLGMEIFLVKDCMINEDKEDISPYRQGSIKDLLKFIKTLPQI